jgi:hypothetical protein
LANPTFDVGRKVTPMDDEIPNVRNPVEQIGEDKDGIAGLEKCVAQKAEGSDQAEPPKGDWNHHLFPILRSSPLDDESGEERQISNPPDYFPGAPGDSHEAAAGEKDVVQIFHEAGNIPRNCPTGKAGGGVIRSATADFTTDYRE